MGYMTSSQLPEIRSMRALKGSITDCAHFIRMCSVENLARPRTQLTGLRDMREATIWNCLINDILLVRAALGTHNILS